MACEYAVCFANAGGGVAVFGVADKLKGRAQAIQGTQGHDVDVFKRAIYDGTRPGIEAEVFELPVPEGTGRLLVMRVPKVCRSLTARRQVCSSSGWARTACRWTASCSSVPRWPVRRWTGVVSPPKASP